MSFHVREPNGQIHGPYCATELAQLRDRGMLKASAEVAPVNSHDFRPISELRLLVDGASSTGQDSACPINPSSGRSSAVNPPQVKNSESAVWFFGLAVAVAVPLLYFLWRSAYPIERDTIAASTESVVAEPPQTAAATSHESYPKTMYYDSQEIDRLRLLLIGDWYEGAGDHWHFNALGDLQWRNRSAKTFRGRYSLGSDGNLTLSFDNSATANFRLREQSPDTLQFASQSGNKELHRAEAVPSFVCTNDINALEQLICQSKWLAALDQHQGQIYEELVARLDSNEALEVRQSQRRWLVDRNNVGAVGDSYQALALLYSDRIKQLCNLGDEQLCFAAQNKESTASKVESAVNSSETADTAISVVGTWEDQDGFCTYFASGRLSCVALDGQPLERTWSRQGDTLEWFGGKKRYLYQIEQLDAATMTLVNIFPDTARGTRWIERRLVCRTMEVAATSSSEQRYSPTATKSCRTQGGVWVQQPAN